MTLAFWRKWHRWIAFPAAVFLLFVSFTGLALAVTELFGEEEAVREATRTLVSPVTLTSASREWADPIARALAAARHAAGPAPIDRITIQFKGRPPTVSIFTGKPTGGEDREFVVDATTGALLRVQPSVDKPFLNRLHSGEIFGDGGLVMAVFWALALFVLTLTGLVIYFKMRPRASSGIQKVFW